VHLSISLVICSRVTYLSLTPKGDIKIVEAPAPALPQAPSQYTSHGDSGTRPLILLAGSIQSAVKSTNT
jgi:hypothetical protein